MQRVVRKCNWREKRFPMWAAAGVARGRAENAARKCVSKLNFNRIAIAIAIANAMALENRGEMLLFRQ